MARRERDILEHAIRTLAEQAANADEPWTRPPPPVEAITRSPFYAKMLRLEVLKVEGRPRAQARDVAAELLEVRSRRALGLGARRLTRTLGAR
jgi:hypothetical protein